MISDYNAITELLAHATAGDIAEAAAAALKAGVDIDLMGDAYARGLPDALECGLVSETDIDDAVRRVLGLKEALGLFDQPFSRGMADFLPPLQVKAHQNLARESGKRSIVLLTNHEDILPLSQAPSRIAVIGPLADNQEEMLGPWSIVGKGEDMVSMLDGIKAAFPSSEIEHAAGGVVHDAVDGDIAVAVDVASRADVVILFLGEEAVMSGEAASRAELDLPGRQAELARTVLDLGKPVIALLSSGRQLCCPWLFERADAVVATWFLGSEAGHAVGRCALLAAITPRAGCPCPGRSTSAKSRSTTNRNPPAGRRTTRSATRANIWTCRWSRCFPSATACPTPVSR